MVNLLTNLVDRALERAPVLQRRPRSAFEPVKESTPIRRHEDADNRLSEDEVFAESERAVRPKPTSKVNNLRIDDGRSSSREQHDSNATITPIEQPIEVTAIEPKPRRRSPDRRFTDADAGKDAATLDDSLTREITPQHKSDRQNKPEPSIETIVETRLERKVVPTALTDEPPVEEITLLPQTLSNSQQSTPDNLIARQSDTPKQTPPQRDATALIKPAQQHRATRQETQPSMPTRLKAEPTQHAEPATPTINVTIGRVEVRAATPVKRTEAPGRSGPKLSLEDYLHGRSKGN